VSFTRVKPAGWATGERLTSTQMNSLDTNVSNAIDKRSPGLEIDSRSVTRWMPSLGVPVLPETNWTAASGYEWKTAVNTQAYIRFPLDVPHGATITAIGVYVVGGAGHAALPASMPAFTTYYSDTVTPFASNTINVGTTDTSGTTTAFQTFHAITASGLSHVVDRTQYAYMLVLGTESGANALSGFQVRGVFVTFTTTRIDEA